VALSQTKNLLATKPDYCSKNFKSVEVQQQMLNALISTAMGAFFAVPDPDLARLPLQLLLVTPSMHYQLPLNIMPLTSFS
jgi:hypothetical protein